ncbi:MAG: glycosyltransferase [Patescibacteria group bacterium]|nr:glycosyltransferase [Patescibacteria group bacterium]
MKILHIVPTYYPAVRYGGPIKSEYELNKWLVKKGADVTVYTTNLDGKGVLDVSLGKEVIIDGVKVYYFPITFRSWQYSWQLHRALAKNVQNFDLIRITSVFLAVSTLGAYYAKKFKKPYVISPRGSLMKEPLIRKSSLKKKIYLNLVEKRNLKDAIINFTTEMEKKEYLDLNFPLKNSIITPNGIDVNEFSKKVPQGFFRNKFKISNDKKIILSLGRLNWKKGFDTFIPAFAKIIKKEPKAVLVIAGGDDEGYGQKIKSQISNLKIEDKTIFTGMLAGDDKIAVYQDSNIFVLPSYSENFGNVVLEAAYFGLPVVVTKGVAVGLEFEKAGAGIAVEKNVQELAEAILKILKNSGLGKKMGIVGKKFVETEFSWLKITENFIKKYSDLLINKQINETNLS